MFVSSTREADVSLSVEVIGRETVVRVPPDANVISHVRSHGMNDSPVKLNINGERESTGGSVTCVRRGWKDGVWIPLYDPPEQFDP